MQPRDRSHLLDMLDAANLAREFVAGIDWDAFQDDLKSQAAITRQLGIVGEAANRLPEDVRGQYPQIPWRQIVGLRNRIAHEYDRLNLRRLWDTVQIELPELIRTLTIILDR